jgi:hypothetical protein
MSSPKVKSDIEFKVLTDSGEFIYQGFERKEAVRAFSKQESQFQYERRDSEDWKLKFYKP